MAKYIVKRFFHLCLVLVGVSIITFLILHLAPGDPARLMLPEGASDELVDQMREKLGLNKPLLVQYVIFMTGILHGDLGTSLNYQEPCLDIIMEFLPATVILTLTAVFFSVVISLILGVTAGLARGSWIDFFAMFFALIGQSMSPVWLGILLIYVFALKLRWFPPFGYGSVKNLVLPAITIGLPMAALVTRLTRAGMIDVLQEDYILATRAKGIPEKTITFKYALKNVLIPIITIVGIQIGTFLGGAVVAETIFGWPGIGRLSINAILARDFPLVQAIMLVTSFLFVMINLIVDLLYTVVDPRLRIK